MSKSLVEISSFRIVDTIVRTNTCIELLFLIEGDAGIFSKNSTVLPVQTAREGHVSVHSLDIIMLNPTETYEIHPVDSCTFFSIMLPSQVLISAYGDSAPVFICNSAVDQNHDYSFLRSVLSEIVFENLNATQENHLLLDSLTYRLLHVLKEHHTLDGNHHFRNETKNASFRIESIRLFIMQNYRYTITLNNLAEFLFLTPQYLSKFIKKYFNITFYKYLTNVRLESAKYDLADTDDNLTNIAFNNGFPNLTAFNSAFKKTFRMTPAEYRKQVRTAGEAAAEKREIMESPTIADYSAFKNKFSKDYFTPNFPNGIDSVVVVANAQAYSPMRKTWNELINVGFASDFKEHQYHSQIETFQKEINFQYARVQGIIDDESTFEAGKYSFVHIDKLLDFLCSIGVKPFIEIGNKQKVIVHGMRKYLSLNEQSASHQSDTKSFFRHFLKHVINRYGPDKVKDWKFEVWSEYDNVLDYTPQLIEKYVADFKDIYNFTKNLFSEIQIGGPGFNAPADMNSLVKIISGLKKLNVTPDFISLYIYPYTILSDTAAKKLTLDNSHIMQWEKNRVHDKISEIKNAVAEVNPDINEYLVTEWNVDHISRNPLHDSIFKAPFILYNVINNIDLLDAFGYSVLSDISCEYKDSDSLLFGGPGLLTRNGIKKPSYYAYYFLSRLGPNLIQKGENYIITSKFEDQYEVIMFNYKHLNKSYRMRSDVNYNVNQQADYLEDLKSLNLTIKINHVNEGKYNIKQYQLNHSYGSILDEWFRLHMPDYISQSEVEYLERICIPKLSIFSQKCGNQITLQNTLEPNEANLFIISREY